MLWSRKFDPSKDLVDLAGKVVVVTGANTGIGYETAKLLARKGAKVYVGSRSPEKGSNAIEQLKQEGVGMGEVVYLPCDISTPVLARQSAEGFLERESRLDILVSNAATLLDGPNKTAQDGITEMMMVNHIGMFQFTISLLPLLLKTSEAPGSDVRIVTVGSNAHRLSAAKNPKLDFSTLDEFKNLHENETISTFARYCVSKLCNTLFTNALQRRLSESSIIALSLHPGFVHTSAASKLSFPRLANFLMSVLAVAPEVGAYNSCFAAASPLVREHAEKYKGGYLEPVGKLVPASDIALNVKMQDDLWKTTEEYIKGIRLKLLLYDLVEKAYGKHALFEENDGYMQDRIPEIYRFHENL